MTDNVTVRAAEFATVGKAAMEHARVGRADIDAIRRELEHLKKARGIVDT